MDRSQYFTMSSLCSGELKMSVLILIKVKIVIYYWLGVSSSTPIEALRDHKPTDTAAQTGVYAEK